MSSVLKGNFETKKEVTVAEAQAEGVEDRFEREALKRLGGSIAFVSKKKVMWGDAEPKPAAAPPAEAAKKDAAEE